ncbi:unnamed protein product [Sphagnum jensenii]|uniref:Secreted protein n=1 Tax=Sphagnum jensenii TaxID=128206 RepID=A0ABP1AJY1_9BRYO
MRYIIVLFASVHHHHQQQQQRGKRDRELTGAGGRTLQRRKGVGTKPRGRDQERGGPSIARLRERRGRGEE